MKKVDVTIDKKLELCTEIASDVTRRASNYKSEIWVESDGKKAKSLLGVVSLGLAVGCSLTISAEGEDEHEAIKCFEKMFSV